MQNSGQTWTLGKSQFDTEIKQKSKETAGITRALQLLCIGSTNKDDSTDVPVWPGSQRQREVGLSDEGPAGKPVRFPQPSKQQDFIDNSIVGTEMQQSDNLDDSHAEHSCFYCKLSDYTLKSCILHTSVHSLWHDAIIGVKTCN